MRLIFVRENKQNVRRRGAKLKTRLYTAMNNNNRQGIGIDDTNRLVQRKIRKLLRRRRITRTSKVQLTYLVREQIYISSPFFEYTDEQSILYPFNRIQGESGYGFEIEDTEVTRVLINYFK